jgi:gas vesicle protein
LVKKGFFNGLLTGACIGTIAGMMLVPRKKLASTTIKVKGKTKDLQSRAEKMAHEMRRGVTGWLKTK